MSSQTLLNPLKKSRLQAVINRNVSLMGNELGRTHMAEHAIVTRSLSNNATIGLIKLSRNI